MSNLSQPFNPDAVRAVDSKYTQLPADYIKNRTIQIFGAPVDTDTLKTVIDNQHAFGLIKTAPDLSKILWSGAPTTTGSKRSTKPGPSRWRRARGETSSGKSVTKTGPHS